MKYLSLIAVSFCLTADAANFGSFFGTFTGNGGPLTNLNVTVKVWSNGVVVGPLGQVSTVGTTTAGIQEAVNSLTNYIGPSAGGLIELGPGVFTVSGQIAITTKHPIGLTFKGCGENVTILKYTGATNLFQTLHDSTDYLPNLNIKFENFGMAYVADTNRAYLVNLDSGLNECMIEGCMFTTWNAWANGTNQGGAPSIIPQYVTNRLGTVGLYVNTALSLKSYVRKCNFMGLACGIYFAQDHSTIQDCFFSVIGHWTSNGVASTGTAWLTNANTSAKGALTNLFSTGSAIIFQDTIYEANVQFPYFYECSVGITIYGPGTIPTVKVWDPRFEVVGKRYLIAAIGSAANQDRGQITTIYATTLNYASGQDGFMIASNGVLKTIAQQTTLDSGSLASRNTDIGLGIQDYPLYLVYWGTVVFSVDITGGIVADTGTITSDGLGNLTATAFIGDGSQLSGLNAAALTGLVPVSSRPMTNFTSYAVGTAYTLTGTSAQLDFGTTDPIDTINQAGTYLIFATVGVLYSGATYAGAQTVTFKLRRTNNTAADLTGASRAVELPVLTTYTGGDIVSLPPVIYTATLGDVIGLFGILSATPAAGSVQTTSADIVAIRLY